MAGPSSSLRHQIDLQLLDGFDARRDGASVELPVGAQRLVAFVALHDRPVPRDYVGGMLWIDSPDERAAANLRTTLWRIQQRLPGLVDARGAQLALGRGVTVDLHVAAAAARREIAGEEAGADAALLGSDLLPGWYDEWLILERERFRQLRLAALDALCERHLGAGRLQRALDAALVSLAADPLRESAHRALIRVHLAAGNTGEALRQLALCRRLLREQLGVEPSADLARLIDDAAVTTG